MELLTENATLNNLHLSDNELLMKYNKLVYDARKSQQFGNEYHLLEIATFLKLKIYIYQSFKELNGFYHNNLNSSELNNKFMENRVNLG